MKIILIITSVLLIAYFNCNAQDKKDKTKIESGQSIYELLQGKWKSTDDPKAVIEFKNQYFIDYYGNEKFGENKFWLDKACPDQEGSGNPGVNERHLISDEMCWYIYYIDKNKLELTYLARGNTLTYKKIK